MHDANELEKGIIDTLGKLPIPISITPPDESTDDHRYTWQYLEGSGTATSFDAAIDQALHFLIGRLAGSATPGLKWLDWYSHGLHRK